MSRLKDEVITSLDEHRKQHRRSADHGASVPGNFEELTVLAREMLTRDQIDVSKVHPLFWSMVETYVDRFQTFPFDATKAMHAWLAFRDYPAPEMEKLIKSLQQLYRQKHGDRMPGESDSSSLDEELQELRDSLRYASISAEMGEDC